MKNQMQKIATVALSASFLMGGLSNAQETRISTKEKVIMKQSIADADVLAKQNNRVLDNEEKITAKDLPKQIQKVIKKHFPNQKVVEAEREKRLTDYEYEVKLDNNVELSFDAKHKLVEVESDTQLPNSIVPNKILTFVSENYSDNFITDWKLDGMKQEVELNNGVELEFNKKGDFLRIDK
ncbi:hypothetical protein CW751_09085 [Brumimicrobium salinarum]|uniref:Putative beta-lactamase-inhibitor-like PepSY-like domain-containing protein n=1 Tax=Brumimicrobium salinarum TaxID=2058658 RepID=A0A2I0R1S9_9FLAO|nr:PepSY-like domain-containing protein [Brumimicrobium salinarum]PKR80519.1 hypothetical protein CW751_09085 [Brumimicrobium salinarum]